MEALGTSGNFGGVLGTLRIFWGFRGTSGELEEPRGSSRNLGGCRRTSGESGQHWETFGGFEELRGSSGHGC